MRHAILFFCLLLSACQSEFLVSPNLSCAPAEVLSINNECINPDSLNQDVIVLPDADNDSIIDALDNCPTMPNDSQLDTDADQMGDVCDLDIDNDGVENIYDNCPLIANARQDDLDNDQVGNFCDNENSFIITVEGDDFDQDGIPLVFDNCDFVANPLQTDLDFDNVGDDCDDVINIMPPDSDGDGISDVTDNCVDMPNANQLDSDADNLGDVCDDDDDNDGVLDANDACPTFANPNTLCPINDRDGDGIADGLDNCLLLVNPSQLDTDSDGAGNDCDGNDDGDTLADVIDPCPLVTSFTPECPDLSDTDADGLVNSQDNCEEIFNPQQEDLDFDNQGDACETPSAEICDDAFDNDFDLATDCADSDCQNFFGCNSIPACVGGDAKFYLDADDDGFGFAFVMQTTCVDVPPAGYVLNDLDCNDANADIYPDAPGDSHDQTDGLDNDCDGRIDEIIATNAIQIAPPNFLDSLLNPQPDTDPFSENEYTGTILMNGFGFDFGNLGNQTVPQDIKTIQMGIQNLQANATTHSLELSGNFIKNVKGKNQELFNPDAEFDNWFLSAQGIAVKKRLADFKTLTVNGRVSNPNESASDSQFIVLNTDDLNLKRFEVVAVFLNGFKLVYDDDKYRNIGRIKLEAQLSEVFPGEKFADYPWDIVDNQAIVLNDKVVLRTEVAYLADKPMPYTYEIDLVVMGFDSQNWKMFFYDKTETFTKKFIHNHFEEELFLLPTDTHLSTFVGFSQIDANFNIREIDQFDITANPNVSAAGKLELDVTSHFVGNASLLAKQIDPVLSYKAQVFLHASEYQNYVINTKILKSGDKTGNVTGALQSEWSFP